MKVLFDTNVILDVLLEREPHILLASRLFALVDHGLLTGSICATTATTLYYIGAKAVGDRRAHAQVRDLLSLFDVAPVDRAVLDSALALNFSDFEDAVLHEAARLSGMGAIVTRDPRGFAGASLPVFSPAELLAVVAASSLGA